MRNFVCVLKSLFLLHMHLLLYPSYRLLSWRLIFVWWCCMTVLFSYNFNPKRFLSFQKLRQYNIVTPDALYNLNTRSISFLQNYRLKSIASWILKKNRDYHNMRGISRRSQDYTHIMISFFIVWAKTRQQIFRFMSD